MATSEDIHREIMSYNLRNRKLLRYLRDKDITKAEYIERLNEQYQRQLTTDFRYDHPVLQRVRNFKGEIPFDLMNALLIQPPGQQAPYVYVMNQLQKPFFREKQYFVAGGGLYCEFGDRLLEVVYGKIGKKRSFIAVEEPEFQGDRNIFLFSIVMKMS